MKTKPNPTQTGRTFAANWLAASKAAQIATEVTGVLFRFGFVTAAILAVGVLKAAAQTTLMVDSTSTWVGFMNVSELLANGGGYDFGSLWGTADLRANFDASGTNYVTLTPCTNVWETADTYWVSGGAPNKIMDANFYVQNDTLSGQILTFRGACLSNTLAVAYTSVAFIKDLAPDYSYYYEQTVALQAGQPFSVSLGTTPGDHIQYGFETTGPDANPVDLASLGSVVVAVNNVGPTLSPLAGQVLVEGQNAIFAVNVNGTGPFTYLWDFNNATTSTVLSNGPGISGATSNILTVSNVSLADAGTYTLTVNNLTASATANSTLAVLTLLSARFNLLIDPSFEQSDFSTDPTTAWVLFNGAAEQNSGYDYYNNSDTPVSALDGSNCVQLYSVGPGSYNGVYQDRPALPGQVYTASAWFLTPITDEIGGANQCYIEVQFRDASGNLINEYRSASINSNTTTAGWVNLTATNNFAGDFVTLLGNSQYLVAPAGTATVRYQITYQADPINDLGGSVYVDDLNLRLRAPVAAITVNNATARVSFPTIFGPIYQAYYKTNLTDALWHTNGSAITGDGTVKTFTNSVTAKSRFYIINTQ